MIYRSYIDDLTSPTFPRFFLIRPWDLAPLEPRARWHSQWQTGWAVRDEGKQMGNSSLNYIIYHLYIIYISSLYHLHIYIYTHICIHTYIHNIYNLYIIYIIYIYIYISSLYLYISSIYHLYIIYISSIYHLYII